MTEQEAKDWLKLLGMPFFYGDKRVEAIDMGINALEKQIVKKTFLDGVGSFIRYWHCPICKEIVGAKHKYCHECGQRLLLDWGNEDAE